MRLIVEVVSGADRGHSLALKPGEVRKVGRGEEADLIITEDSLVSRLHFSVEWTGTECRVRDLGSRNGTAVNGTTVKQIVITGSAEVTAGNTHLRVRIVDDEAPPRKPIFRGVRDESEAPENIGTAPKTVRMVAEQPIGAVQPETEGGVAALDLAPRRVLRPYRDALGDVDPEVRRAALYAAAWAKESWLIDYCLAKAKTPTPHEWEPLYLLAVLGRSEHFGDILALTKKRKLGPGRFSLIGTFGRARGVPALLDAIAGDDPEAAEGAAAAFEKITAIEIPRRPSGTSPGHNKGVEKDTAEDLAGPDPAAARSLWKAQEKHFDPDARWCRGVDVTAGASEEALARFDMESRFEEFLRGRFEGRRSEGLAALYSFPLARKGSRGT